MHTVVCALLALKHLLLYSIDIITNIFIVETGDRANLNDLTSYQYFHHHKATTRETTQNPRNPCK